MTGSAPDLLCELIVPCSLSFLDPCASNVSGMPAHPNEEVTLLPRKLTTSHCHKHGIIILTLENQLCLAAPHVSRDFPSPQQGRTHPELLMTLEPVHLAPQSNLVLVYNHKQDS